MNVKKAREIRQFLGYKPRLKGAAALEKVSVSKNPLAAKQCPSPYAGRGYEPAYNMTITGRLEATRTVRCADESPRGRYRALKRAQKCS